MSQCKKECSPSLFKRGNHQTALQNKHCLDPEDVDFCRPVANIRFLGKVFEQVVAGQLQALLDNTDFLDAFQSGLGTKTALVTL